MRCDCEACVNVQTLPNCRGDPSQLTWNILIARCICSSCVPRYHKTLTCVCVRVICEYIDQILLRQRLEILTLNSRDLPTNHRALLLSTTVSPIKRYSFTFIILHSVSRYVVWIQEWMQYRSSVIRSLVRVKKLMLSRVIHLHVQLVISWLVQHLRRCNVNLGYSVSIMLLATWLSDRARHMSQALYAKRDLSSQKFVKWRPYQAFHHSESEFVCDHIC